MANYNFLFTYSVSVNRGTEADAQKVRQKIAKIEKSNWQKLTKVETTFGGTISLVHPTIDSRRQEAASIVENVLKDARNDCSVTGNDVDISAALLVDSLGKYIEIAF